MVNAISDAVDQFFGAAECMILGPKNASSDLDAEVIKAKKRLLARRQVEEMARFHAEEIEILQQGRKVPDPLDEFFGAVERVFLESEFTSSEFDKQVFQAKKRKIMKRQAEEAARLQRQIEGNNGLGLDVETGRDYAIDVEKRDSETPDTLNQFYGAVERMVLGLQREIERNYFDAMGRESGRDYAISMEERDCEGPDTLDQFFGAVESMVLGAENVTN